MKIRKIAAMAVAGMLMFGLFACGTPESEQSPVSAGKDAGTARSVSEQEHISAPVEVSVAEEEPVQDNDAEQTGDNQSKNDQQEGTETMEEENGYYVVIDAGHQGQGNSDQEPIGPGASQTKAKVSSGTQGCVTGLKESELNLAVSLKLEQELKNRGYKVLMIRTSQDVDISNAERAETANSSGADCFIRVHANGSDDSLVNGAITICQTPDNPFNASIYGQCRKLSEDVLDALVSATGCNRGYIWETDDMSGINWCQIPVTIVEMGYMTNPDEDQRMATEEYQEKIAQGIADGIDRYFE